MAIIDFRVSKDNIGVVMHSSPVEWYESINCRGKYVEVIIIFNNNIYIHSK